MAAVNARHPEFTRVLQWTRLWRLNRVHGHPALGCATLLLRFCIGQLFRLYAASEHFCKSLKIERKFRLHNVLRHNLASMGYAHYASLRILTQQRFLFRRAVSLPSFNTCTRG